ncbi:MAG: tRNA (adenosine(37)-N6)-threonylcarbamoyltransferase complex ATPase subunit type 1 TsaE [Patescibacteria group bacterium]
MRSVITENQKETKKIAGELAKKLIRKKPEKALVIALSGELGSGKTTFVSGFSKILGVNEKILSPTFIIMHKHELNPGKKPNSDSATSRKRLGGTFDEQHKTYKFLYHIDAYRLENKNDLLKLGVKKLFYNPENIVMIEWADKVKKIIPKRTVWIYFKHSGKNKRTINYHL